LIGNCLQHEAAAALGKPTTARRLRLEIIRVPSAVMLGLVVSFTKDQRKATSISYHSRRNGRQVHHRCTGAPSASGRKQVCGWHFCQVCLDKCCRSLLRLATRSHVKVQGPAARGALSKESGTE
jgi:hypothetical protein